MKTMISILVILLVATGCASLFPSSHTPQGTDTKPVKEPTPEEKKVVGTYELKRGTNTYRMVFLDNGVAERYHNGSLDTVKAKWFIGDKVLYFAYSTGAMTVYRINPDGKLTASSQRANGEHGFVKAEEEQHSIKIK